MHGPKIRRNNSYGGVQSNIRTRRGQYRYSDGRPYTGNRIHMHNGRAMEGAYHSPVPHEYLYKNNGGGMSYMTEEPDIVDPCPDGCFQNMSGGCDCYASPVMSGGNSGGNYGTMRRRRWRRRKPMRGPRRGR